MSFVSNAGRGLIRWTPKILEASANDIARFGPNAAQVRALLNFIPTMSDDAIRTSDAAYNASFQPMEAAMHAAYRAIDQSRGVAGDAAASAARRSVSYNAQDSARSAAERAAMYVASTAAHSESLSDLITPEVYRTLTNPMASARALDRLAGRAPESFVPIARDLGERGLVTAPSDIVTARRIAGLPPQQQTLIMGLIDSGLTLEDAMLAARALS